MEWHHASGYALEIIQLSAPVIVLEKSYLLHKLTLKSICYIRRITWTFNFQPSDIYG